MEDQSVKTGLSGVLLRIALCAVILCVGLYALHFFSSRKKPPHKAKIPETAIRVDVAEAVPVTVQTRLPGFGVVQAHRTVHLSSEVTGRIVFMHPDLSVGRHIAQGEILFRLDPSDYQAAVTRLTASRSQIRAEIQRIETELQSDQQRLITIRRNRDLARSRLTGGFRFLPRCPAPSPG